ncbi:hypothetical protein CK222_21575 [Mesorhizobium sp. WSM3866]|uniref:hypothetical protein n=1 Tax=Mesorhizobium sp. WSM3866 TaxID=422271 RepID=UPI000BAF6B4E|nr:hypothetical protein [Mesorhizobium sp. WSM3866]PBB41749.1 hypothetical protein CK222_21575 [Mesorhizobium sp. WSM3866]RWI96377.1 MAG: hypothetical protein EOR22_06355 [Mesorhizobium sp.]TIU88859.1 MAG: hypothetical protein E5W06_00390 [Mesorhizobium sp.]
MTAQFDTLGYAQALKSAGVPAKQAEAHAKVAREYLMPELATKADIAELRHLIERQTLQLTVRLGGIIVVGIGVLAALKLLP